MKHMTLYNTVARSPCAYCKQKCVSLTKKQVERKECESKKCRHFVKYEKHEYWRQQELKKRRKKENKQLNNLFISYKATKPSTIKEEIMVNFEKLCMCIIDTNGEPTDQQIREYGYDAENFRKRMETAKVTPERLVKNAVRSLNERGIPVRREGKVL